LLSWQTIQSTIRDVVANSISDSFVLPNRKWFPLVDEAYLPDMTSLAFPRPEAVVRMTVRKARDLTGMDWNLFGK